MWDCRGTGLNDVKRSCFDKLVTICTQFLNYKFRFYLLNSLKYNYFYEQSDTQADCYFKEA